jgi:hypothetical protein
MGAAQYCLGREFVLCTHKTRYRAEYSVLSTFMEPMIYFLWISTLLLKDIS